MVKIGIIGYGYWGVNILRNFMNTPQCVVGKVCDQRSERLALVQKSYPSVQVTTSTDELINDPAIDAVVIVTPVFLHYALAKKALEQGKHVLVEKPFTASVAEAEELIELAQRKNLVIGVDHTFLFTGSVQRIKNLVDAGELGSIQYFDSTRVNLGLFQPDVNVIWDLAPHDISILHYLVPERPVSVICTGQSHTQNRLENIAYLSVNYQSDFMAHFACSWISPVKIRRILIGGDKKMCLYDDVEPTEKVKIYETSYHVNTEEEKHRMLVDYRTGDIFLPKIAQKEALADMTANFINAILDQTKPLVDGLAGLAVVQVLEAAQQSIDQGGKEIFLK
ncbi:MAG: Gfo/Idh/MocA family oxidoreductase [Cytophagaceae bacterium]|nr:Gfo/Idh/MocA family oxidoreductase [Cytophagaceae bacterium]